MRWYWWVAVLAVVCVTIAASVLIDSNTPSIVEQVATMRFVSGTEYNVGEQGQVIAEVRLPNGQPVPVNCSFTIWYPDKTQFLQENGTTAASGNQYINFTIPDTTGVYEYQANCTWQGRSAIASKSFHVSEFQNETLTKLRRIRAEHVK